MKKILTVLLVLCSLISYAQPTLATLDARLKTVETLTKVIEGSTMTLPQFIRAVDSISRRNDSILDKALVGWINMGRRQMNDTINVRLATVRSDAWKLDSTRVAQNAAIQDTNVNQLVVWQTQIRNLLTEIEALKLRITNLKVTIQ